jgi:HEXXH motif-containing protein
VQPSAHNQLGRELSLVAWVAAHGTCRDGAIRVREPVAIATPCGDLMVDPGTYALSALGDAVIGDAPVWLDLYGRHLDAPSPHLWETGRAEPALRAALRTFLVLLAAIDRACPELLAWVRSTTSVVVPLQPVPGAWSSWHKPELPGLVAIDLSDEPAVLLELLVHETAHLHLRAADHEAVLVDPGHDGRYPSPLRPEARPLGGVLLAFHALAYIAAALTTAERAGLLRGVEGTASLAETRRGCREAAGVLAAADGALTDAGRRFVDATLRVAEHGGA